MAIKMIENWRKAHKFASIWWCLAGAAAMLLEILNNTWFSLPREIQDKLPNAQYISLAMFVAIALARIIRWVRPEEKDGN